MRARAWLRVQQHGDVAARSLLIAYRRMYTPIACHHRQLRLLRFC